jgi:hypothetical protein
MRHTPSITTTTFSIAIGCALAANFLTGCGNAGHASGTRTSPKATIHVLVDRSHFTDAARGRQLAAAKNIHLKLAKAAEIHFWAFDSKPIEVVAAGSTLTTKQLVVALGAEIAPQSADIRTITRPGEAIKAVADKASSGAPVSVILITDGDIDDAGDRPTLKAAVEHLVGNGSGGKLTVIGIDPGNRKTWEDILTPAAEQGTTLATWAEASSALDMATKS